MKAFEAPYSKGALVIVWLLTTAACATLSHLYFSWVKDQHSSIRYECVSIKDKIDADHTDAILCLAKDAK